MNSRSAKRKTFRCWFSLSQQMIYNFWSSFLWRFCSNNFFLRIRILNLVIPESLSISKKLQWDQKSLTSLSLEGYSNLRNLFYIHFHFTFSYLLKSTQNPNVSILSQVFNIIVFIFTSKKIWVVCKNRDPWNWDSMNISMPFFPRFECCLKAIPQKMRPNLFEWPGMFTNRAWIKSKLKSWEWGHLRKFWSNLEAGQSSKVKLGMMRGTFGMSR